MLAGDGQIGKARIWKLTNGYIHIFAVLGYYPVPPDFFGKVVLIPAGDGAGMAADATLCVDCKSVPHGYSSTFLTSTAVS